MGGPSPAGLKFTLRGGDFVTLAARLTARTGIDVSLETRDDHGLLMMPEAAEAEIRAALALVSPGTFIVGAGARMELYKGIGLPAEVSARFGLPGMSGTHAIGHTRMATESAVTTAGAHPFSTGRDQCLVHNGSLSNHNNIRRALVREGQVFQTTNDSEVAGRLPLLPDGARRAAGSGNAGGDLRSRRGSIPSSSEPNRASASCGMPVACKPAGDGGDRRLRGLRLRIPRADEAARDRSGPHLRARTRKRVYFWERAA